MSHNIVSFAQLLERDGALAYTNKGISMMPLLRQDRDIMIIEKRDPPYKKYDAVLFLRDNGQYILHRIMKVMDGKYYIIGDNCPSGETVREEQILGVLTGVKRDGKLIRENDRRYRCYVRFWWAIFPLRKGWMRLRPYLGAVRRRVRKLVKGGNTHG